MERKPTVNGIHQYSLMFPAMSESELKELTEDIDRNGLQCPIWIDEDGFVLDGRHRYAACQALGFEPDVKKFVSVDEEDKLRFVVSQNLKRRHLSTSQRAMIAASMAESFEALAKARQESTQAKSGEKVGSNVVENLPPPSVGKSRDQAGAALNVSGKSVDMAKKVTAKAAPEVAEAVRNGTLAVSRAAKIADLPVEEQAAAITAPRETVRRRVQAVWLLLRDGIPLAWSDIPSEHSDTGLAGLLAFKSRDEAIEHGARHFDGSELEAVQLTNTHK